MAFDSNAYYRTKYKAYTFRFDLDKDQKVIDFLNQEGIKGLRQAIELYLEQNEKNK